MNSVSLYTQSKAAANQPTEQASNDILFIHFTFVCVCVEIRATGDTGVVTIMTILLIRHEHILECELCDTALVNYDD